MCIRDRSYTGHGAGVLQEGEGDVTSDFALMVEAALGISAEPVSYTHLDAGMHQLVCQYQGLCIAPGG